MKILASLCLVLTLTCSFNAFALNTDPIKRSDLLQKLKLEYTGDTDLSWLDLDTLDSITSDQGHLMSIVAAQELSERLAVYESEGCQERSDGVWTYGCIQKLKNLHNAFSEYQREFWEEVLDKSVQSTKKVLLKKALNDLDKIVADGADVTSLNYGFTWGYNALKTGFSILETASSDSEIARLEAAWEIVSLLDFGPASALASGYVDFLFDFIANYDQSLRASWSNMYFGFYRYAKARGVVDTYFVKQNNVFLPKFGTPFYNMMNGIGIDGEQLSRITGPFQIGWDDDEYALRIEALFIPTLRNISTSNLDDIIRDGNGLIAFYENKPDIDAQTVQTIFADILAVRDELNTSNTLFEYLSDPDISQVSIQYLSEYPLNNVTMEIKGFLNDDESVDTFDQILFGEIKDFRLESLDDNSYLDTRITFNALGMDFERRLSNFTSTNILADFAINGEFVINKPLRFDASVYFNISTTGGYDSIEWDFGDDSSRTNGLVSEQHTYKSVDEFTVTMTAVSQNGIRRSLNKTVSIAGNPALRPQIESLSASPQAFEFGDSVTLTANVSSPDDSALSVKWAQSVNGTCSVSATALSSESVFSFKPLQAGTYCFFATNQHGYSTDSVHLQRLDSETYIAANRINLGEMPARYTVGLAGTGASNVDYDWDFGNGQTESGSGPFTVLYEEEGIYTVTVKATLGDLTETDFIKLGASGEFNMPDDPEGVANVCGEDTNASSNKTIACYLFKKPYSELDLADGGVNYNYNNWGDNPQLYQGNAGHSGLDMQTKNVVQGNPDGFLEPFYAVTSGKVIAAENGTQYNRVVVYDNQKNISVIYLHAHQIDVAVGDNIKVGDKLGIQGDAGSEGAWHVHIEVQPGHSTVASFNKNGTLNPTQYIIPYLGAVQSNEGQEPVSIDILGNKSIDEGGVASFVVQVNYDGGYTEIAPADTWELLNSPSFASISSSGRVSVSDVERDRVMFVKANYGDFDKTIAVFARDLGVVTAPTSALSLRTGLRDCPEDTRVSVIVFRPSGVQCPDSGSTSVAQLPLSINHNVTLVNGTLDTEGEDIVIEGDLLIENGVINLNGGSLFVRGNLTHSAGAINFTEGALIVGGNYRMQRPTEEAGVYTYSSGTLTMANDNDYMRVDGDFYFDGRGTTQGVSTSTLNAGVLELKSNFTQLATQLRAEVNFSPQGSHRVLLSGSDTQNIRFASTRSYFNELELRNTSPQGVVWLSAFGVGKLYNNGNSLPDLSRGLGRDWTLYEDVTITGGLTIDPRSLNLNGFTLTVEGDVFQNASTSINGGTLRVEGNYTHARGALSFAGGTLIVGGDYRMQTPTEEAGIYGYSSGTLMMTNNNDYMRVDGDFYFDGLGTTQGVSTSTLSAGVLEIKGDFTQLASQLRAEVNFSPHGSHRVLLSGSGIQNVRFASTRSYFNELELRNTSPQGVVWLSAFGVGKLYNNGNSLPDLSGGLGRDWTLHEDVTITGGLTIDPRSLNLNGFTLTVEGNVFQSASTSINGGTLRVEGNYTHARGALSFSGGSLIVGGDYRMQTPTDEAGVYSYSSGTLTMTDANDYMRVDGDFYFDGLGTTQGISTSTLSAGVLELKGNVTQFATQPRAGVNFSPYGNHRVLLSGNDTQNIRFASTQSYFNELELRNDSLVWLSAFGTSKLYSNGNSLPDLSRGLGRDWTLNEDITIAGSFTIDPRQLSLNGFTLTVKGDVLQNANTAINGGLLTVEGNYTHANGTLSFTNGSLTVGGDYRMQRPSEEIGVYLYGFGRLNMTDTNDYMRVEGDVYFDGIGTSSGPYSTLSAGLLELKGDFTQLATSSRANINFTPREKHRVLLSGDDVQNIQFASTQSYFNELELRNSSLVWLSAFGVGKLYNNGNTLPDLSHGLGRDWTLYEDVTVTGDLTIDPRAINLNGFNLTVEGDVWQIGSTSINQGRLTVEGNYTHANGILSLAGGSLIIGGNYRMQRPTEETGVYLYGFGRLNMTDENDYMRVEGDFYFDGIGTSTGPYSTLSAGLLELKGDFTQLATSSRANINFTPRENHKVLLSGNTLQTVNFASTASYFVELDLMNSANPAVIFASAVRVTKLFNHRRNNFELVSENNSFVDFDGDEIPDHLDPFPTDGNKIDTDNDGISDDLDEDDDNDGMPDDYELLNGLNPLDASDANIDSDNDGLTNLEEYRLGTNPNNGDSDGDGLQDDIDPQPLQFNEDTASRFAGKLIQLGDINQDNIDDIGVFDNANSEVISLNVYSGDNFALIRTLEWPNIYSHSSVHVLPDFNDNAYPEIAVFGKRKDEGNEGRHRMLAKDANTGKTINTYNWSASWRDTRFLLLQDVNNDGYADIAMQGTNINNNRVQLSVLSGKTSASLDRFSFPDVFAKPRYLQLSDYTGDGIEDVGLLGALKRNDKVQVRVMDATNPSNRPKAYSFGNLRSMLGFYRLSDSNNDSIDDWGFFGVRESDNRPQLLNKSGNNPRGMLRVFTWSDDFLTQHFMRVPDMNDDGIDEVSVAGFRRNDRHQISVKDGNDRGAVIINIGWPNQWDHVSYLTLPDRTNDGIVEFALHGQNKATGTWQIVVKDGATRAETHRYDLGSDWLAKPAVYLHSDINADGADELLLHGYRAGGKATVQVWSGSETELLTSH